ncbi:PulJ/GspJ family protein [Shewanella oncorhynchi]|uniref:PulJ/GspJ family protein n=1 Tax=Shewanella oncorhynchi TaxID=2726434 RepID=UPI003D78FBBF
MNNNLNKSKGFTLIEVMVAGVILFIALSSMTMVYRTAVISSLKASGNVTFSSNVGLIINTIQGNIRNTHLSEPSSGEGTVGGVNYKWSTSLIENKGAAKRFDVDEGMWVEQPKKFYLWNVELVVEQGNKTRNYHFKELSWTKY